MARNYDAAFNDMVRKDLSADTAPRCDARVPPMGIQCQRRATTYVTLHRWGCCNEPEDPDQIGELDADGNICEVMCARCADRAHRIAAGHIRVMLDHLPRDLRDQARCPTCNRPTVTADDICELRPL